MAVPKRKHSKSRTRRRRKINGKLALPTLVTSPESGELVRRHRVDLSSGFYRGKRVIKEDELS
ncbi:MAG: 50S ribosomal protein L32 [Alkalispirochaeta sp.]